MKSLVTAVQIEQRIYFIRGHKVMLDTDLAELYAVSTKRLNEQVRRNKRRFPLDFVFRLTVEEIRELREKSMRSQFATASKRNIRFQPYAFTEHGALMAANILKSSRAIEMSVFVVRAFVKPREILMRNKDLEGKVADLERQFGTHDTHIREIFSALRELMDPPMKPRRRIGFKNETPS